MKPEIELYTPKAWGGAANIKPLPPCAAVLKPEARAGLVGGRLAPLPLHARSIPLDIAECTTCTHIEFNECGQLPSNLKHVTCTVASTSRYKPVSFELNHRLFPQLPSNLKYVTASSAAGSPLYLSRVVLVKLWQD